MRILCLFFLTIIFKVTQYVANAAPPTCATVDGVYDQSQAGNMTISPNPPKNLPRFFLDLETSYHLTVTNFYFCEKPLPAVSPPSTPPKETI